MEQARSDGGGRGNAKNEDGSPVIRYEDELNLEGIVGEGVGAAAVPMDPTMIAEAYDDDDFWLPASVLQESVTGSSQIGVGNDLHARVQEVRDRHAAMLQHANFEQAQGHVSTIAASYPPGLREGLSFAPTQTDDRIQSFFNPLERNPPIQTGLAQPLHFQHDVDMRLMGQQQPTDLQSFASQFHQEQPQFQNLFDNSQQQGTMSIASSSSPSLALQLRQLSQRIALQQQSNSVAASAAAMPHDYSNPTIGMASAMPPLAAFMNANNPSPLQASIPYPVDVKAPPNQNQREQPLLFPAMPETETLSYDHAATLADSPYSFHSLDMTSQNASEAPSNPSRSSKKRKSRNEQQQGQGHPSPAKALTAYNFFFRFERDRLLKYSTEKGAVSDEKDLPAEYFSYRNWTPENSVEEQQAILHDQWSRDPNVKRKHCKAHGRISFQALTKRIAATWKSLPDAVRAVFAAIAEQDAQRYARQLDETQLLPRPKSSPPPPPPPHEQL